MVLNFIRDRKIRTVQSLDVEIGSGESTAKLSDFINSAAQDPSQILESKETVQRLKNAVACLPEKDRQVFVLCDIEKMHHREVAEILDCPYKAVAVKLFDAIASASNRATTSSRI